MPDLPKEVRQAQAEDWCEDLIEFGPGIVAEACRQWRRQEPDRRPTPGHIRELATREVRRQKEQRKRQLAEEIRQRSEEICDQWARDRGYRDFAEAKAYGAKVYNVFGDDLQQARSVLELETMAAAEAERRPPPVASEAAEKREQRAQLEARRQQFLDRWARDRGYGDFADAERHGASHLNAYRAWLDENRPLHLGPGSLAGMGEP
jgi:hypothetical protein